MMLSPPEPPSSAHSVPKASGHGTPPNAPQEPPPRSGYRRAWRLAWLLHAWLLGGALVASWVYQSWCSPASPVHVFELYAPPQSPAASAGQGAVRAPSPRPATRPAAPPPRQASARKAPPTPERLSYASFKAKHAKPSAHVAPAAPASASKTQRSSPQPALAAPRLDTHSLTQGLQAASLDDPQPSGPAAAQIGHGGTQDPLAQYIGTLKQALEALWAKPTGLPTQAQAQVSFTLSASGTLLIFKIIHSSGHPAFDASVTQVFQAARALPPPPSGQACSFVLTFKATDT